MSAELHSRIRTETDASRTVLESTLYSREAGFDETPSRMIATAVSELVRNILKYAGTGEIRLRQVKGIGRRGIEIEAIDQGPGIAGLGLPGVKRMMDEFSLESTPGKGTRVTARKWI